MFGSLGIAHSGLTASQVGLSTTGHNISNAGTQGYSRQQIIQSTSFYRSVGTNGMGQMSVGMGTNMTGIRQIRDQFLDIQYRSENSRIGFHESKRDAGLEIEALISELNGENETLEVIDDLWNAINELSLNPQSIDSRGVFVTNAVQFVDKMNAIYKGMKDYQQTLNVQVKDTVYRINELVEEVHQLNEIIVGAQTSGDNANDYLDLRNNALDELSALSGAKFIEKSNGSVDIQLGGNELLSNGIINNIGLRYTDPKGSLVEPVFTQSKGILNFDDDSAVRVYDITGNISASANNDKGLLKGILIARGTRPETYMSNPQQPDYTDVAKYPLGKDDPAYRKDYEQYKIDIFNSEQATIPSAMKKLDTVFNAVVKLINDTIAPRQQKPFGASDNNDPMGLDGSQYMELFVRKNVSRYGVDGDGDGLPDYNEEIDGDRYSQYTLGNVEVNSVFLDASGYDKIPLSPALGGDDVSGNNTCDLSNNSLIINMMAAWKDPDLVQFYAGRDKAGNLIEAGEPLSLNDSYGYFVNNVATTTSEAAGFAESQATVLLQLDNNRLAMSGVSTEEELTNMMKYQHAFDAAARVINAIDSMIDKIVNQMK